MLTERPKPAIVIHYLFSLIVAVTLFTFSAASTIAQNSSPNPEAPIPLEGLDPVMLSQGKEVP